MTKRIIISFLTLIMMLTLLPTNIEASKKDELIDFARKYIGVPYQWGGTTPSGFDCSGYLKYAFNHIGVTLPRTTVEQFNFGESVSKANLQKGDIVFFETYRIGPSHSGIYIGNNHLFMPHLQEVL